MSELERHRRKVPRRWSKVWLRWFRKKLFLAFKRSRRTMMRMIKTLIATLQVYISYLQRISTPNCWGGIKMVAATATSSAGEHILKYIWSSSTYPRGTRLQLPSQILSKRSSPRKYTIISRKWAQLQYLTSSSHPCLQSFTLRMRHSFSEE